MAISHEVKQGEHLSQIAAHYKFASYTTIWDDPQNAGLKTLRGNPNVLFPGDVVYIPDRLQKSVSCVSGRRHRFKTPVPKLHLRLTLEDFVGQPIAGAACRLSVDARSYDAQTDGKGHIDIEIPQTSRSGTLKVQDLEIPVRIGHLDPVSEESGVRARLTNLGYYRGPDDPVDDMEFRSAVEEFQCDEGLEITGICDGGTLARLEELHGC